jgi:hypothetical protein
MFTIIWPLLVALVGLAFWYFNATATAPTPKNGVGAEAGKIMFAVGMFWLVFLFSGAAFTLGR